MNIWEELGLAPGSAEREIKLAYARRLKQVHPEDDAAGFQRLRQAYEIALMLARGEFVSLNAPAPSAPAASTPPVRPPQAAAPLSEELRAPHPEPAAEQLFEQLLATTESGRRATLEWQLRQANWINLDFKLALEAAVARGLANRFEELHGLAGLFASYYGWDEPADPRGREPAVQGLMERHAARRRRGLIEQSLFKEKRRRHAFLLLVKPPRPRTFHSFALRDANHRAMRNLIAHLREHDAPVWRHEVDQDSARWWLSYLEKDRYTVERGATALAIGLLFGPLAMMFCAAVCAWLTGYDALRLPAERYALIAVAISVPLLHDLFWQRPAGHKLRLRLRRHPLVRAAAAVLTLLLLLLSAGAGNLQGAWPYPILALLMLAFWFGPRRAAANFVLHAWPLHFVVAALLAALLAAHPLTGQFSAWHAAPLLGFYAHLLAAFLVEPFERLGAAGYRQLKGKAPERPRRLSWLLALALCLPAAALLAALPR